MDIDMNFGHNLKAWESKTISPRTILGKPPFHGNRILRPRLLFLERPLELSGLMRPVSTQS